MDIDRAENHASGLPIVRVRLETDRVIGKEMVNSPEKAVEYIMREFGDLDREVFMVLNLDVHMRPINLNIVSMGTLNQSIVHPRETFKASLLSNAFQIICIHNHPGTSGIPEPSEEDIAVTNRLTECGKILGIEVADHLIIGPDKRSYYSFRENAAINHGVKGIEPRDMAAEKHL